MLCQKIEVANKVIKEHEIKAGTKYTQIEVANKVIKEYEIKTGTKYSVHFKYIKYILIYSNFNLN